MRPVIAGYPCVEQVYDFAAAREPSEFAAKDKGRPSVHLQMPRYVPEAYNKVQVTLSTHKIGGLTLNDFIVAAKIDALANQPRIRKAA